MAFSMTPLNFNLGSSAGPATADAWGNAFGAGNWSVNVSGSGKSNQSASASGGINWLLLAACVGAAWFILKK